MSMLDFGLGVLKLTTLLLFVSAVAHLLRHRSAAVRHLIWMTGLVGAVALPVLTAVLPTWELVVGVPARAASAPWSAGSFLVGPAGTASSVSGGSLVIIWGIGAALMLLWMLGGEFRLRARLRISTHRLSPEWRVAIEAAGSLPSGPFAVRFVECAWLDAPCTWGVLRPLILLPTDADHWSPAQRRYAVLHELAHVARGDLAANLLARLACVVHWYHPMVWSMAGAARLAREEACDNAVLGQDVVASDYAALLLSLGVGRDSVTATLAPALGLAHHSTLGIRLCALLDETRDRSLPRRGKIGLTAALGAVMLAGIAMAAPAQQRAVGRTVSTGQQSGMAQIAARVCAGRRPGRGPQIFSVVVRDSTRTPSQYTMTVNCSRAPSK
ncbi:MAG: M56 family metallopeptidase [Gemmatimonadales bacterium]|nr:M56 family metallopeptidase [Gemmatimonadales bacterium]MBP6570467.1 M56 family metallopeptidase [Gemmatimonadales bacterium]MBP7619824.1 M56 family metallopeptidase [Gemmatimonadales bacterium]MBP9897494.1 M56 family metallopeptidase [Gemmatimonadales bacterium]